MACARYGGGARYGDGTRYCAGVLAVRRTSAIFFEALAHALSVKLEGTGPFRLDTIKALAQDQGFLATGYGVFPDVTAKFLSVRITGQGAFRLDAIRPAAQVLERQPIG